MRYFIVLCILAFPALSLADHLCFEWTPFIQGEPVADKLVVYQDNAVYIDNIPTTDVRACGETLPPEDRACRTYYLLAETDGGVKSEINADGIMLHGEAGNRPPKTSTIVIVVVKPPVNLE